MTSKSLPDDSEPVSYTHLDVYKRQALDVARRMLAEGADVHATDPEAISRAEAILPQITYHHDPYDAVRDAEALLICTEWEEFSQLDWERVGKLMARRLVIDGRNLCSPALMREHDFEYFSFGRESVRSGCMEVGR